MDNKQLSSRYCNQLLVTSENFQESDLPTKKIVSTISF